MSDAKAAPKVEKVAISAPKFSTVEFRICGDAPLVINKFSQKAKDLMKAKQQAGSTAKKGQTREAKDFQACYEGAKYKTKQGWCGINASAFRCAAVSACRTVNFKMTLAKLSIFIVADGFDAEDGTPLVKITKGEPKYVEHCVRNDSGVADIRPRPMWDVGWEAIVKVRFDSEQFKTEDVANLMMRIGMQVGIGEGRPDSKDSCGMGWGTFKLVS